MSEQKMYKRFLSTTIQCRMQFLAHLNCRMSIFYKIIIKTDSLEYYKSIIWYIKMAIGGEAIEDKDSLSFDKRKR